MQNLKFRNSNCSDKINQRDKLERKQHLDMIYPNSEKASQYKNVESFLHSFKFASPIFLAVLFVMASGCGFTLANYGSVLPKGIDKIYVEPIVSVANTNFANRLRYAMQDQIEKYGTLTLVSEEDEADAVYRLKIVSDSTGVGASVAGTDQALQLNANIVVSGELIDKKGNTLWKNKRILGSRGFGVVQGAVLSTSSGFAESGLNAADFNSLSQRELARGQQNESLSRIADSIASSIYVESVLPPF